MTDSQQSASGFIFHVTSEDMLLTAREEGVLSAESLATEGFIHCSFSNQLEGVLQRYFSGVGEVFVVEIEVEKLTSELRVEESTGNEDYPHVYGQINIEAVSGSVRLLA